MVEIRPATLADRSIIRAMVFAEHLDPTSLNWRNFLIAEQEGEIIGIGQIKTFPGCNELGSLVTRKSHRGQGVARQLILALEQKAGFPVYLLCESRLENFYAQFGFRTIGWRAAPMALKIKLLPTLLFRVFGIRILVMRKDRATDILV